MLDKRNLRHHNKAVAKYHGDYGQQKNLSKAQTKRLKEKLKEEEERRLTEEEERKLLEYQREETMNKALEDYYYE